MNRDFDKGIEMKTTLNFGALNIKRKDFIDSGRKTDANRLRGVENKDSVKEVVGYFQKLNMDVNVRPTDSNKAKNSVAAYLTDMATGGELKGKEDKLMKVKGNVNLPVLMRKLKDHYQKFKV